jgi:hypothetical protein
MTRVYVRMRNLMPNFTDDQKQKLERIATAMLVGMDILSDAGVEAANPAVAHLAQGHAEIMRVLYPDGVPVAPGEEVCPCGQPSTH